MTTTNTRSIQIIASMGLLVASAILFLHTQRRRQSKLSKSSTTKDHNATNEDELTYYQSLGIINLPPHILRSIAKEQRRKSKAEFLSMKSPMYDNVFMLDPQKKLMCTISLKKAKWYVRKGIAEWTNRPTTLQPNHGNNDKYIRLLFQPNGDNTDTEKSPSELLYLRTPKQNICVSCGSSGHHMRHYIVPYSYRSLFPPQYKSHMSHDIVIVCPDCHLHIDRETKRRMNRIESELRDLLSQTNSDVDYWCLPVIDDTYLYHVRSCAIALVKWRENMPVETVKSHEREVRMYLASLNENDGLALEDDTPLTKAQLQSVCAVNYRIKNPEYITGSELVVKSLDCDGEKIESFIKEWRQHFLDIVRPRFMPKGWSVDNPVVCGRS
jgi:hypothetical protein